MDLPCKSFDKAFRLGNSSVVFSFFFCHQQPQCVQLILRRLGLVRRSEKYLFSNIQNYF